MNAFAPWLEHRIPPPLVAVLAAIAMRAAAGIAPAAQAPATTRLALTTMLCAAGAATIIAGLVSFWRARTTVNPLKPEQATSLVTSGVYRVTRNPMYLGMALLLCAWAAELWSPWALAGPVAFVAFITRFQIIPEERALIAHFGDAFTAYAARVRRWL